MLVKNKEQSSFTRKRTLNIGGKMVDLSSPLVMGILNVTPDSFYDGGKYLTQKNILERAETIITEGGKIIDIGAFSTRPGSEEISIREELNRLVPAIAVIRKKFPDMHLSVDTYRSTIAKTIIYEFGPCIINDISGGTMDQNMFQTVADLNVPYILMHIQGTPQTMQDNPVYNDLMQEIILFLAERVRKLKLLGVNDIIVDPGFGFGKKSEHNYELINRLDDFKIFELPVLVGVSRKAMVWKTLGVTPGEALNGTTVLNTLALLGNADILRVHDVKEAVEACKIMDQLKNNGLRISK